jgi:MerR family transcriptional regulator/heat shock protein HspR
MSGRVGGVAVASTQKARNHSHKSDQAVSERAALEAALRDSRAPLYSVGQVAELLDVRPWFLRRLDALGVVTPTRSEGDQRRYSREDLERLIDARTLMREGVSVAGIRQVLALKQRVSELEAALSEARQQAGDRDPSARSYH